MHRFKPVTIRDPATGYMTGVSDVERALEIMQTWPVKAKKKAAYVVCARALDDPTAEAIAAAREAFIEAAKEAKVWRGG